MNIPTVKIGQYWQDWDIRFRSDERIGKITSIQGKYVLIFWIDTCRTTKVRVDRLIPNSTGYKYLGMALPK